MLSEFYLDDYNLICSNISEELLEGNLKLLKNDREIDFSLDTKDNIISLSFLDEYKEGDKYTVVHNNSTYAVMPRLITHTTKFDETYKCDVNTLGSFYEKDKTTFRLWAPLNEEAYVVVNGKPLKMNYLANGIYELVVMGDLEKHKYHYEVFRNNKLFAFKDLFSYVNAPDSNDSIVIDLNHFKFNNIKLEKTDDPIIYELNVRDFSSDIKAPFKYRGKFKAFSEEGLKLNNVPIGIDYLSKLGVTHIQLMPITSFNLDGSTYNWGYNPIDFNTIHNDYVVGTDAYSSIEEFRELVDTLHSKGLKVNLDLVYNHIYRLNNSNFEKILPYYFFRFYKNGKPGDASFCGNETRSESYFFREYINLLNKRFITLFDIDGIRFDLMGLIDVDSTNYFISETKTLKEDFMMYGEGWNMGEILPDYKRTTIENAEKVKEFAFFNSYYRDSMRGPFNEKYTKGYLQSNKDYEYDFINGLTGTYNHGLSPLQSINYIECHDNLTYYDKLTTFGYDEKDKQLMAKLALGSVILSCGIPFVHAGQEFLRTKKCFDNSYNLPDEINRIDWELMTNSIFSVDYFKKLIAFRKAHNIFKTVPAKVEFYYELPVLKIDNLEIIYNNTEYPYIYNSWITFKNVYSLDRETLHDIKAFDVPKYSIIIAEKA